ncbi:hypothetical protein PoB_001528200 [Plakobranchus ocellatus]|uniref:Uncharacterized protein n=1 Tax=Plakobranchus ocellatus TaxID=259542 RepID=A0AAV3Z2Q6_9GAST|nr:hypothetical protein PoB_001528200 [Plakobranchus ocellatus]
MWTAQASPLINLTPPLHTRLATMDRICNGSTIHSKGSNSRIQTGHPGTTLAECAQTNSPSYWAGPAPVDPDWMFASLTTELTQVT